MDYNKLGNKQNAFTLAEVLITLVIIGIIAAVTVPTLMANYRKQEVSSRLKKFYSNLSNAVRLTNVENPGFMKGSYSSSNFDIWWNDTIGKYMPVTKQTNSNYAIKSTTEGSVDIPSTLYVLNDGTFFYIWRITSSDGEIVLRYDINGEKGPNALGRDVFMFYIQQYDTHLGEGEHWLKVCAGSDCSIYSTREKLIGYCKNSESDECTRLIQMDGWEIKDDYPLGI